LPVSQRALHNATLPTHSCEALGGCQGKDRHFRKAQGRRNALSSRIPAIRRRRLAAELRRLREAAGLTIDQVADALECSSSKISRIETEQVSATPRDVRDMLSLYGVEGQQLDALVQISREARQKGWWHQYRNLPDATLIGLEAAASSFRIWEITRIPALFQTPEYARASLCAVRPNLNAEDIERRIEIRQARQGLLVNDNPPELWAVLDEAALQRPVGGHEVMTNQLKRLSEVTELPNVTVQLLPFTAGEQAGMEGPFTILSFPDIADSDIVFAANGTGGMYLEDRNTVLRCRSIFDHLRAAGLSPEDSVAFLARMLGPNER
jgi:transcriptional regulator with XRE-family HTH domain